MNEQPDRLTPYQRIGGEDQVRQLVERFYDHMDSLEEARGIRSLHAKSLRISREKLFKFLSGWLGGPDLYTGQYGHPRLRARHLPFSIGQKERDQWMFCMKKALKEIVKEDNLREELESALWRTADHMRNKAEHEGDQRLSVFPGNFSR